MQGKKKYKLMIVSENTVDSRTGSKILSLVQMQLNSLQEEEKPYAIFLKTTNGRILANEIENENLSMFDVCIKLP